MITQTKKEYNDPWKVQRKEVLLLVSLLIIFLFACTPKYVKIGQPNAKNNLIIFVGTPFMDIDPLDKYTQKITFYEKIRENFAYMPNVFILDDRIVLKEAITQRMFPPCEYKNNNPDKKIINLSLDGIKVSKFLNVAKGLQASHIVIAKLVNNEVISSPYVPYNKNIVLAPGILFSITQKTTECSPTETLKQTISIEFSVIDVTSGNTIVNAETFTSSKSTGLFAGPGLLTTIIFNNLVKNLLLRIQ